MTTRSRLRAANLLMTFGVLPWLLVLAWVMAFFLTTVPGRPPRVFIIDPLGMIGLMMMSFLFALCVAGAGLIWSWLLTRAGADAASRTTLACRWLVVLALLGPPLALWLATALGS